VSASTPMLRVAPRFERSSPQASERPRAAVGGQGIRLAAFAALALFGAGRWAVLLHPAPTARLLGLLAVAVTIAGVVPRLRRLHPGLAIALTVALVLVSFPIAGLPWQAFVHERIAASAREIGHGLSALAGVLVPYTGSGDPVVLVTTLGAAVLLLDGAIVLAFAPTAPSDLRRAAAALPLIGLAIVPATLVRPQLPYLQGLILFALLAAFLWGDRLRREAAGAAVVIAALAGVGSAVAAGGIDPHRALVDYRAWAGSVAHQHLDAFDWNQTYGPLRWPKTGHAVLAIRARQAEYWKATDLDAFNGYAWVSNPGQGEPTLPAPDRSALARWTQNVQVTIQGMRTQDVIAAGYAAGPPIPGGGQPGSSPGTWTAERPLGPGAVYRISTYSPSPSAVALRAVGHAYPDAALAAYRTLSVPQNARAAGLIAAVTFPPFHSRTAPSVQSPAQVTPGDVGALVHSSPYWAGYALARHLEARAPTPYAFVQSVAQYLSRGYQYNEKPPLSRFPLESFLFKDRLGYCQQFSGAMAMLLRMGGIPARVAAGFTSGQPDYISRQWTVSDTDAHAWVEVWFPHYGWVRFDPTPATAPARGGQSVQAIEKTLPGGSSGAGGSREGLIGSTPSAIKAVRHARSGSAGPPLGVVAAGLAVLVLLGLGRILIRRPVPDEQLLVELERALARSRRPLEVGVTLAGLERRFRDSPAAAEYLRSLRLARYAGAGTRPTAAQRRALRAQLRHGLGLSGRLRALWALPPRVSLRPKRSGGGLRS